MSKMHPIPTQVDEKNPTFKCWNCGEEFKAEHSIAENFFEVVAYARCPKCGKTCTQKLYNKPFQGKHIK